MNCTCKWLRYTPIKRKDGETLQIWTCLMCGQEFDVIAIRQRMIEGQDVNELSVMVSR